MRSTLLAFILISLLTGCGEKKVCNYPSIIPADGNDATLTIVSQTKNGNYYEIVTKGCYKGDSVGLKFMLKDSIPAENKEDSKKSFVENGVKLISTGAESDMLLKAIADMNKLEGPGKFSSKELSYPLYSQAAAAIDYSKGAYRILMLNNDAKIDFNQYITFDFTNKQVVLINSGPDYIGNFLTAMTQ